MKLKNILAMIGLAVVIAATFYIFFAKNKKSPSPTSETPVAQSTFDGKNASFEIEGVIVRLTNGKSEIEAAPGSATKITTRYFGNEATGDLNGDGLEDVAYLITQDGGGSGLFYYAVVALKNGQGYKTTNAALLGDRIAPQSTEIRNGQVYVNYAQRKTGEPMITPPSVGVTKTLKITGANVLVDSIQ